MAINLLAEVVSPSLAMALTAGPDQTETQSFEPVGTTEMVDLFSGDFNYNIPLLTVPGPNGGYPVNLAYHAGITPDQEASWVGLGWNVNVGTINRNMRGLPDDFFGEDVVKKSMSIKPNWIFGLQFEPGVEIAGQPLGGGGSSNSLFSNFQMGMGVYYNNYKGIGVRLKMKSLVNLKLNEKIVGGNYEGFDVSGSFDSQSDVSGKIKIHLKDEAEGEGKEEGLMKWKDAQGVKNKFKVVKGWYNTAKGWYDKADNKTTWVKGEGFNKNPEGQKSAGDAITFANPSFIPNTSFPEGGFDASLWVKLGASVPATFANGSIKGFLFKQHIKETSIDYPSYGYLHLGERNRIDDEESVLVAPGSNNPAGAVKGQALMDFNRGNDGMNLNVPNPGIPALTYDVYGVSGQGIGMVFRPHRSDVGLVYDPKVVSEFTDGELGIDLGLGAAMGHIGVNLGISYTNYYTGKWKGQYPTFEDEYEFTNSMYKQNDVTGDDNTNTVFKNPYYFKASHEKGLADPSDGNFGYDEKFAFEITSIADLGSALTDIAKNDFDPANYTLNVFPVIKNQLASNSSRRGVNGNKHKFDEMRANSIEYKTRFEISNTIAPNSVTQVSQLYRPNEFPHLNSGVPLDYAISGNKKGHHIGKFSVVNPDGNTYVYGLPVYNLMQKEAAFSTSDDNSENRSVTYDLDDATTGNSKGADHFFTSTEIPAYATSYMLTMVYSPDYVDLTGNGPSTDDLGYYVKFNYSPTTGNAGLSQSNNPYKWRVPFSKAIKMEGYDDHIGDDKAAYLYGEKEVYLLNSIETKTHLAIFKLNDPATPRMDGMGVSSEQDNNAANPNLSQRQRSLSKIELYSRTGGTNTLLKTVNFEYSYTLCPQTPNSVASGTKGKLTLTKVYFTYMNNQSGQLSPYEFYYGTYNPQYKDLMTDIWGNYKEDKTVSGSGRNYLVTDFPYVDQDKVLADKYASAWCLNRIKMPSGGYVNIEYEADDYQYVQDKKSMQMLEIVGTGYDDDNSAYHPTGMSLDRIGITGEPYDLIVFKLKRPTDSQAELNNYIKNLGPMYFKANIRLKNMAGEALNPGPNNMAYDYVDGYCDVQPDYGVKPVTDPAYMEGGKYTRAIIQVKYVKGKVKLHPFRKAAFEYMKLRRPELFFPLNGASDNDGIGLQVLYTIPAFLQGAGQAITGYMRYCELMGFGIRMADGTESGENDGKKSYIRLAVPDGRKYGGGHRVSKLSVEDKWSTDTDATKTYGQEFIYELADHTSSGVAEYEPVFGGGAENPLHKPADEYLYERPFTANLAELYQQKPICQNYYPGPGVGYSRVIVKSLTRGTPGNEDNKTTADGVTVHEFYTAKEFPVKEESPEEDKTQFDKSLKIPFIGNLSVKTAGISKGYKITLNDMHGKPKAMRIYPYSTDLFVPQLAGATHEVEYIYNIKDGALNSKLPVLMEDGSTAEKDMAMDRDFVMDMDQNSQYTFSGTAMVNVDFSVMPPTIVPSVALSFAYNHVTSRTFVNVKSIHRQGVLMETRVLNDKALTSYKNLLFDAVSGRPLLTSTSNEFDKPVYTYDIPGFWHYDGLGNRASNYRHTSLISMSGSNLTAGYPETFRIGDQVRLWDSNNPANGYREYWIMSKDPTTNVMTVRDANGTLYSGAYGYNAMTVINPGRKNQLNLDAGKLVSLTNPTTIGNAAILVSLNNATALMTSAPDAPVAITYNDCLKQQSVNATFQASGSSIGFSTAQCKSFLNFPPPVTVTNYFNYEFIKAPGTNQVRIKDRTTGQFLTQTASWTGSDCFPECVDGVLHAEAYTFNDTWQYDYADFGVPNVLVNNVSTPISIAAGQNPYCFGKSGVWRLSEKYMYHVERKQSGPQTNIAEDGTYNIFNWYNWAMSGNANKEWTRHATVTEYSPYGFEVEANNINAIYNSTLYGYNNAVAIASGSGLSYRQLSAQNFEENNAGLAALNTGHLYLGLASGNMAFATNVGHTGKVSLNMTSGQQLKIKNLRGSATQISGTYQVKPNYNYVLSFWFRNATNANLPVITPPAGMTVVSTKISNDKIDGWQRVEVVFKYTATQSTNGEIGIATPASAGMYVDDIRLQPQNSAVEAYVYDTKTLWRTAELDEQNYATFYGYDETGNVVVVKKETEKGIVTLNHQRKKIVNQ